MEDQKGRLQAMERAIKSAKAELMQTRAAMSDARRQLALKDAEVVSLKAELAERDAQLAHELALRLEVEGMLHGLAGSALSLGDFGLDVSAFGETEANGEPRMVEAR